MTARKWNGAPIGDWNGWDLIFRPERMVAGLSTANQQLIEIAKALTLDAKLLILDEPTAALGGEETELLFKQIERLKSEGCRDYLYFASP